MNYLDKGYNSFLLRPLKASYTEQIGLDSSSSFDRISGSQVYGDRISSLNRNMLIDLENDLFSINEGKINRISIGKLPDGNIGIAVYDREGNALLNVTGENNIIQSADGKTFFNLSNNVLQISDNEGTTVVDSKGLVSLTQFPSDFVNNPNTFSFDVGDGEVDVPYMSLTFELNRSARILFFCSVQGKNWNAKFGASCNVYMMMDNTEVGSALTTPGVPFAIGDPDEGVAFVSTGTMEVREVSIGSHTVKLTAQSLLSGTSIIQHKTLGYVILGS